MSTLSLYVSPGTTRSNRQRVLNAWYRDQMKDRIPALLEKWQIVVGKEAAEWGVKRMKTRWGSCNINRRRIWLNLELASKPVECLEYVLVHELVHLYERYHNDNFKRYMDTFMPQWRVHRDTLNQVNQRIKGVSTLFSFATGRTRTGCLRKKGTDPFNSID